MTASVSKSTDSSTGVVWPRVRHFLGGSASGVALVLAGHPFDTVKVRLQTGSSRFQGPLHCLAETLKREGFRGLYKGASPPMIATGFINSVMFGLMGLCQERKKAAAQRTGQDIANPQSELYSVMQCGSMVGVALAFIVTPMELSSQVQYNAVGDVAQYKGPVDCARQLLKAQGLPGLYRGLVPTMFHRGSNYAYFGGYFFAKQWLAARQEPGVVLSLPQRLSHSVFAGAFAGTSFWLVCYPVDVVKNRYQAATPEQYSSIAKMIGDMWRNEGAKAFGRGFVPCIIRSLPANAAAFVAFELAMNVLPT